MPDTVCIAASCVDRNRFFAILCSDGRIEIEGVTSGLIGSKAIGLAPGISAMFADSPSKTKELIDRYSALFYNPQTSLTPDNILEVLREPLECQNRADATAYLSASFGMSYDEFLELDGSVQTSLISGLEQWRARCQLLIVWLGLQFVRIFMVTDRVDEMSSFGTIGCGANLATTSLYSRKYATYHNLREAIYYVYEAKRASESVPGVGKETYLSVLEFNAKVSNHIYYELNERELDRLSKQYAQFGPRPFGQPEPDAVLDLTFIPGMG